MPKLLFVDDEPAIRATLSRILSGEGFEVRTAASVAEAIAEINESYFDILLSDLNIGEPGDGFTVVSAMRRVHPRARTFILTGYPDFSSALEAIRSQVNDYLTKPANIPELIRTLKSKLSHPAPVYSRPKRASDMIRENRELLIENWFHLVSQNAEIMGLPLSRRERVDHLPELLNDMADRVDRHRDATGKGALPNAEAHGKLRRRQGYSIPMIIEESRLLYQVVAECVQANLLETDISWVIPDLIQISDSLGELLAESVRGFLTSLKTAA